MKGMQSLTTIQNVLDQTSVDMPELSSEDATVKKNAEDRINKLIHYASTEVINRIGYDPVQDKESTRNYVKFSASKDVILPEPVRSISSATVNGEEMGVTVMNLNNDYSFSIRFEREVFDGQEIAITGKFGLVDTLEELQGCPIQSAVNARVWSYMFKNGLIRNTSQGSNTTSFSGDSWMNPSSINSIIDSFKRVHIDVI